MKMQFNLVISSSKEEKNAALLIRLVIKMSNLDVDQHEVKLPGGTLGLWP